MLESNPIMFVCECAYTSESALSSVCVYVRILFYKKTDPLRQPYIYVENLLIRKSIS